MASTDTTFAIAALAAKVHTIGEARAVLNQTAAILLEGYAKLPEITTLAGLRDESRRQLDIANAYTLGVSAIYSGATPDLFDEEISFQNAARVGLALERSRAVLVNLEDAASTQWWDIVAVLEAALAAVSKAAEWTGRAVANAAAAVAAPLLSTFWPYLLIIAVGVFLYIRFGRKILAAGGA